jgi:O-antigen/teichoic acid export membrane protein
MGILKQFYHLRKNELFLGSLVLLILLNFGNVINYIFQVVMARMLGPVEYGTLAVLTSIIYIFGVPTLSIQTIVSKHTTKLAVKGEYGKIRGFFEFMTKKCLLIALVIFIVFSIFSFGLSKLLDIPIWLLIFTGTFLFGAFIYPVSAGIIQGIKKFSLLGWNNIANYSFKLVLSIILVIIGFKVYGAVLGFLAGMIFGFLILINPIKKIEKFKKDKEEINIFSKDILITFFALLFIVLIYSIDVIFARIFFTKDIQGEYAVISMIGKIILFGALGIGYAMFPIASEGFERGNKTRDIFKKALLGTLLWCFVIVAGFSLFPELSIRILFGSQYIVLKNILSYVAIAFSFASLLNLFVLYKLSNNKFKVKHVLYLLIFLIMEIAFFYIFKNNIESFSIGFMLSTIITFIGCVILIRE